jgi:8-oxo-dGTP pyrophosphatase MutT (NUDIX family)
MVTGKIEKKETASQAAFREIQEETGLIPYALYSADAVETFYMHSLDQITSVPIFVGFVEEEKVKLSIKEHDTYEWLSYEEAKERLFFAEQKRGIEHVHQNCVLKQQDPFFLMDVTKPKEKHVLSRTGAYGIALQNEKILLVRQKEGPYAGKLDLPGGKIEKGESIEEALRREFEEETALSFDSIKLYQNMTSLVEGTTKENTPYILHRIGLIYFVDHLAPIPNKEPEMESLWVDLKNLSQEDITPFVEEYLQSTSTLSQVH